MGRTDDVDAERKGRVRGSVLGDVTAVKPRGKQIARREAVVQELEVRLARGRNEVDEVSLRREGRNGVTRQSGPSATACHGDHQQAGLLFTGLSRGAGYTVLEALAGSVAARRCSGA